MKSLLGKLDTVLITAGALMLLAFFIARGWSHAQSQSAIVSFENARVIAHLDTEVSANIGSFGWTGSRIPYYEGIEKMMNELLDHKFTEVRKWAETMIKNLDNTILKERIEDEERFLN